MSVREVDSPSAPARWFSRWLPVAASIGVVLGLVVTTPANSSVDAIVANSAQARSVLDAVATNPTVISIAFLGVILFSVSIGPAVRPFRRLAPTRGALPTELGWRLLFLGSIFVAIANAYAALSLPATIGFDRHVMADFVVALQNGWVAHTLLGVYLLQPAGAILMGLGLFLSRNVAWWLALMFAVVFAAFLIPIGLPSLVQAMVIAVVLVLLHRRVAAMPAKE